jgi:hypothetical protein
MLRFTPLPLRERSRMSAVRALFVMHGAEATPEGRSLPLLRHWLSPAQAARFAEKGYRRRYGQAVQDLRAVTNVCEVDEKGRQTVGLCFLPIGELPIGDVMLSQKIALENSEIGVLADIKPADIYCCMSRHRRAWG